MIRSSPLQFGPAFYNSNTRCLNGICPLAFESQTNFPRGERQGKEAEEKEECRGEGTEGEEDRRDERKKKKKNTTESSAAKTAEKKKKKEQPTAEKEVKEAKVTAERKASS